MEVKKYLPSTTFTFIAGSLFLSIGLVWIANFVTHPNSFSTAGLAVTSTANSREKASWAAALNDIQAQQGSRLPQPPDQQLVDNLLQGAQTKNLTDSVGRSLLINVTNASGKGLGGDQPTQNQLIASAMGQLQTISQPSKLYTLSDISVILDSKEAVQAYGNALIPILKKHPHASMAETLNLLGQKINGQTGSQGDFSIIAKDYQGLAKDFSKMTVPQSLSTYHLAIVNDYLQMADSMSHMQQVSTDPLRGLAGLQMYNKSAGDIQSMFISIAQVFAKDGILFTRDEPGALLASMLSGQ